MRDCENQLRRAARQPCGATGISRHGYPRWSRIVAVTLKRLRHPDGEEQAVLSAIIFVAAETMPRPGGKIRAVGVNRCELEAGRVAVAIGMLPLHAAE